MEGTETANVAASGMGCHNTYFITTLWYWRSYCFEPYDIWWNMRFEKILLRVWYSKLLCRHHKTRYCQTAITTNTKFCIVETVSNPLLKVADIAGLSKIAKKHNLTLIG
jgi:methionine-gamma-lyase